MSSLEIVNEPFAYRNGEEKLRRFYEEVYKISAAKQIQADLYFHDGFNSFQEWEDFLPYSKLNMDHHVYEVFTNEQVSMNLSQHLNNFENIGTLLRQEHQSIVGEFSGALTDCTKYINGDGIGARYDGSIEGTKSGSCQGHEDFGTWTDQAIDDTKKYIETQMKVYSGNSRGWIWWCCKTENTIEWDWRKGIDWGYKHHCPHQKRSIQQVRLQQILELI